MEFSKKRSIVEGLRLILVGMEAHKTDERQTKGSTYSINYLHGVICPNCKAVGTIARVVLSSRGNIGILRLPDTFKGPEFEAEVQYLDRRAFTETSFDPTDVAEGEFDQHVVEQIADEAERLKTPWLCCNCTTDIDPKLFVEQLARSGMMG